LKQEFQLGARLKDKVSGLEGIAVGRLEYLNGCIQYCIKAKVGKDNKIPDAEWIDSQQLEKTGEGINVAASATGGFSKDAPSL
jgi:hypothetical protein